MNKNNNTKERLFEIISKIDSTYKPQINENVDPNKILDVVKQNLGINDWDSPESVQKRKQTAKTVLTEYNKIMNMINNGAKNEIIYRAIQNILTMGWIGSLIASVYQIIFHFGFSDAFSWLKTCLFLFVLKFLHAILHYGIPAFKKIRNFYDEIKKLYQQYKKDREENPQQNNQLEEHFKKIQHLLI